MHAAQVVLLCIFIAEKIVRLFNAVAKAEFVRANFFEVPLLIALLIAVLGAGRWFNKYEPATVRHAAVGIYLVLQVVTKLCKTSVNLAASGKSPSE